MSLIVKYPVGLEEDTKQDWVTVEKGEIQTKYWPSMSWQTPPMPDPEAPVVPIQVGGEISSSRKCVVLLARLLKRSRHASSLL